MFFQCIYLQQKHLCFKSVNNNFEKRVTYRGDYLLNKYVLHPCVKVPLHIIIYCTVMYHKSRCQLFVNKNKTFDYMYIVFILMLQGIEIILLSLLWNLSNICERRSTHRANDEIRISRLIQTVLLLCFILNNAYYYWCNKCIKKYYNVLLSLKCVICCVLFKTRRALQFQRIIIVFTNWKWNEYVLFILLRELTIII